MPTQVKVIVSKPLFDERNLDVVLDALRKVGFDATRKIPLDITEEFDSAIAIEVLGHLTPEDTVLLKQCAQYLLMWFQTKFHGAVEDRPTSIVIESDDATNLVITVADSESV
jgi:hypothetical protein